jgi:hypothetical protein
MFNWFSLDYIYYPVSGIMWLWYKLFALILGPNNFFAWALTVMFLVFSLRALLYKPFVRQIRTTRQMQELQPQIKALQKKHGELLGGSRNLQQECNAAKHQLESEKCSHLTLSSTVDALNMKKKTLDIDVAQRKAAYAADVENTSTSLQAIPDTLDNPGEWVKGFICSMFRYT